MSFSKAELQEIKVYIFHQLPLVFEEDPSFATVIEGIVAQKFPRRDEFARLLDELTALRLASERVEARQDQHASTQQVLQQDVAELRHDVAELRTGQDELRTGQDELRAGQDELRAGQDELRRDVTELRAGQDELRTGQDELRRDVTELRQGQTELRDDVSGLRTDVQQLQEGQKRLERVSEHTILRLDALGDRWGRRNEATVRSTLRGMFASLGYTVERYEAYDTEGKVHFHPASVEIDIIIRDGELWLVEIKGRVAGDDLHLFLRKSRFYAQKTDRQPTRLIVVAPVVEEKARVLAREMGIEVYSFVNEVKVRPPRPRKRATGTG